MIREIALDTETTGLDPYSGHRIVEIGCVELIDHVATGNHFHTYLNPERDMPREAENVHGLSASFLQDKPLFRMIASSFLAFIGDSRLVIHNAAFDLKFLNAELEKEDLPLIEPERATDTVLMARKRFPGQPANLDALCKRFNIDTSKRTKHGALLDAQLLAEIYLEMMGGRQASLLPANKAAIDQENLEAMQENTIGAETSNTLVFSGHTQMPVRSFPPTSEELAAHRALLEKIKNPLWKAV